MKLLPPFLLTALLAFSPLATAQETKPLGAVENPLPPRDEASELLFQAKSLAIAGDKEAAFALCEKVLQIPMPPEARPPSMFGGPVDWRGNARWQMAQIRRSQGRWSEALALYQLNRETYPLDDGCMPSGAAFQEMMMVEGECLEHLGCFDEAAALYFPAAVNLAGEIKPEAMQRLFDLYRSTGQLDDLTRNIEREKLGRYAEIEDLTRREEQKALWPLVTLERVRHFRTLARSHKWNEIALIGHIPDVPRLQIIGGVGDYNLSFREAVDALMSLDERSQKDALQKLQEYVKRNQTQKDEDNRRLLDVRVAILMLRGTEKEDVIDNFSTSVEMRRDEMFGPFFMRAQDIAPRQPAPIPAHLKLPAHLSKELKM